MGKLKAPESAGWNAGKNYYARMMKITDIIIDPDIARIFKMSDQVREEIKHSIEEKGFDKSQPLGLWKGKNIILDGHTRLAAAKEAGLLEVPVVEMNFENKEDAVLYTFERQVMRRNLTQAEILAAVEMMPGERARKGEGRTTQQLAERLGVSPAHIYQVQKVLREAPSEVVEAVRKGETTVKEAYVPLIRPRKENSEGTWETITAITNAAMVNRLHILKSAVVLLSEKAELTGAALLMRRFLKKSERQSFMAQLPEAVQKALSGKLYRSLSQLQKIWSEAIRSNCGGLVRLGLEREPHGKQLSTDRQSYGLTGRSSSNQANACAGRSGRNMTLGSLFDGIGGFGWMRQGGAPLPACPGRRSWLSSGL